ncbi:expressed unknown protein [Seminavis robusta]|uniref:Uncharacterized protein n=1 Tax=Seminavis robusta TaxID=568900 RepID=A0A9N8EWH4_9STRA|nr:expressed unknown protein [Seminavis robusta]|eukprot:Sro1809_g299090.1 n/a (353) ;mRNA; r:18311-19369
MMRLCGYLRLAVTLVLLIPLVRSTEDDTHNNNYYIMIGVSGGLQEGFPAHDKLHYNQGSLEDEVVKAIFLGRGLVRGYKAFLDLMQEGWREYTETDRAVINPNVFASGCQEHANEYWIYLVDARQVMSVLNHEPRHLSMTPDTGMIELEAEETHSLVRDFLTTHIRQQHRASKKKIDKVAIPLVTAVYFNAASHIPSPPIRIHDDGTQVTNFPDSLALWAGVDDRDRTMVVDYHKSCRHHRREECTDAALEEATQAYNRYWAGIRQAIGKAEEKRQKLEKQEAISGPPFQCQKRVKFGVGKEEDPDNTSTRVNYPMTGAQIESVLKEIGFQVDLAEGEVVDPLSEKQDEPDL